MRLVMCVLLALGGANALFFPSGGGGGGGGGCGCCPPPPPPPPCPPPCPPQLPQLPQFQLPQFQLPQFQLPSLGGGSSCCTPSCPPPCPPPSCGCKRRKRAASGDVIEEDLVALNRTLAETSFKSLQCNNEYLRNAILNNLSSEPELTKEAIVAQLRAEMPERPFGVICTENSFTYAIDSTAHCLEGNNNVHCYAYYM